MRTRAALLRGCVLVLVACCARASLADEPAAKAPKPKNEIERLAGTWIGVSYQEDGKPPREFTKTQSARLTVTEFSLNYHLDLEPGSAGASRFQFGFSPQFAADLTKTPMELLSAGHDDELDGSLEAMFELDDDRLTWCWTVPNEDGEHISPPRGQKLKSTPDDGFTLITFRRQNPPPKK